MSSSRSKRRLIVSLVTGLAALPVVALGVLKLSARAPSRIGTVQEELPACPDTPNCVASQAENPDQRVEPFTFDGSAEAAWESLQELIRRHPRATITTVGERYLHAEFRTRWLRFVDDVEFLMDPDSGVIHVRSASRVGRSDLGANRRRVEALRESFRASRDDS